MKRVRGFFIVLIKDGFDGEEFDYCGVTCKSAYYF